MSEPAPVTPTPDDVRRPARVGLALFVVYVLLYAGFMGLNVFRPRWMAATFGGVNAAILYGFGLIAAALALAFVYTRLCGAAESPPPVTVRPDAFDAGEKRP